MPHARRERTGTVIVIVVVLLLVAAAIAGAILRTVTIDVRQFSTDRNAFQADRLAEGGLARAAASLAADSSYSGDEWIAQLPGDETAKVTARVIRSEGTGTIEVVAAYPAASDRPIRARRTTPIN
jgi:type II secretory pathway component PulK